MKARLHESAPFSSCRPLLETLGFEIVEARTLTPPSQDGGRGAAHTTARVPIEIVFWDFSSSPELAAREVERLAADSDLSRVPFVGLIPGEQIGLEMALLAAGCEGIVRRPVTPASLQQAVASLGREYAEHVGAVSAVASMVLFAGVDGALQDEVTEPLAQAGVFVRVASRDFEAAEMARRFGFDLCLLGGDLASDDDLVRRLRRMQPEMVLLVLAGARPSLDDSAGQGLVRLSIDSSAEAVRARLCEILRERSDLRRSHELSEKIVAQQRELQRVNETLRTINKSIKETNVRLERQGHLKDEMVGVTAHELKSPLAAISGALDILWRERERFTDPDRELLELMQRNCVRMIKLVEDILDLARLEAGRITIRPAEVNARRLIEQAVSTVAMRARLKSVLFDVPFDELDFSIMVDEARAMQMLVNLLDNAVKFSPREGIVRVHVKTGRSQVHFVVSDSGPGIPESERRTVFERFNRKARGDDPHSAGSGLGLTITHALALLNGGTVSVGESPDGGAQFTISLPL